MKNPSSVFSFSEFSILQEMYIKKISLMTPLLNYYPNFGFLPKNVFPKFEIPNSGCSLSASVAYLPVFKVTIECLILFQQALCKEMRLSCLPKKSMEGER